MIDLAQIAPIDFVLACARVIPNHGEDTKMKLIQTEHVHRMAGIRRKEWM